jgi:hypothetical protein
MTYSINNFEAIHKKVLNVCIQMRRELSAEVLSNAFPIQIKQWSTLTSKYAHIFYDAEFGKDKTLIKYLKPTSMIVYMQPIYKAFERAGFQYIDDAMIIKAAEVLTLQQFYHMNCYNRDNFKRHAIYINGNLTLGDYDTEVLCFGLATRYYAAKNDMRGVNISRLFNLLYDRDTVREFESEISETVLKDIRHKTVKSFRPEPALV